MNRADNNPMAEIDSVHTTLAVTVFALATLAEARDSDTCKHILRIQQYVDALAQRVKDRPRFSTVLTDSYRERLQQSLPLYDMGTIGIPDRILLKPGRLSAAEIALMRTHTTLARDAIVQAEQALDAQPHALQMVMDLAYCHHEKWDGSGYPQGLSGERIPLSARLTAIADVYDALISDRVYKVGVSHEQATNIIAEGRGSHFDPDLVDAFLEIKNDFEAIAQRLADTDQDMQKKIEYMANAIAEEAELPPS